MIQQKKFSVSNFVVKSVLLLLIVSSLVFSQTPERKILDFDSKTINNLKTAINSENPGLRKSGIYLAGKYAVDETSDALVEQLAKEKDPSLRILLVRVLYILDDQKFMDDILNLALNDPDLKVKRMATAVYSAMSINNSDNYVEINQ